VLDTHCKSLSHFDGCGQGAPRVDDVEEPINVGMLARVPAHRKEGSGEDGGQEARGRRGCGGEGNGGMGERGRHRSS